MRKSFFCNVMAVAGSTEICSEGLHALTPKTHCLSSAHLLNHSTRIDTHVCTLAYGLLNTQRQNRPAYLSGVYTGS